MSLSALRQPAFSTATPALARSEKPAPSRVNLRFAGETPEQTPKSVQAILDRVQYKPGFYFVLHGDTPETMAVQVQFDAVDVDRPGSAPVLRTGARKWPVPTNYNEGQIVQTLFMALKAVEEHEQRETFYYKGAKIFNPHFNMDALSRFLQARLGEAAESVKPPRRLIGNDHIQAVLNDCKYRAYRFQLIESKLLADNKMVLQVELVQDRASSYQDTEAMDGKRITFVTTPSTTHIVRNLMDALIDERFKELRYSFKHNDTAIFSNDVDVEHLIGFSQQA